jgi:multiple sugar transport system permease protein
MTIGFILASLVPLFWMVGSSMKDSKSINAFPPKWIPPIPQTINMTLDYDGVEMGDQAAYELDAMKAIWYSWRKQLNSPIGEMRVTGVRGNQILYQANTLNYMFQTGNSEIVPTNTFNSDVMARKVPLIQKKGYSKFTWLADEERAYNGRVDHFGQEELPTRIAEFIQTTDHVQGNLISIDQKSNIWRILDNYIVLFVDKEKFGNGFGFGHYLKNSVIVTFVTIVFQMIISGLTGYALAHLVSRTWAVWLTLFFVATMMIPEVAILIPLYLTMKQLHLTNTLWGIIAPHTAWGFVIFLFKGFFEQLSVELIQAARVEGASEFGIFRRIVIPMSIPIFTLVAVMTFIPMWNGFLWPLVVATEQQVWTLTVALNNFQETMTTNILMASMVVSTIPLLIVFLSCQRLLEKGLNWSGSKG